MSAEGIDANILGVSAPHGERAVVGLQYVPPIVILDREHARIGRVPPFAPLVRKGRVAEADAVPAPTIRLEDAAGGSSPYEGEVAGRVPEDVVQSIEAAAYVRESERADQALGHAIPLHGGQSRIFGRDLAPVVKLKSPDLQGLSLDAGHAREPDVQLLGKQHGRILAAAIGRQVVGSESKRSLLRSGSGRTRGQAEYKGHREFG